MNEHAKQNAGYTAIAAVLMLLFGWKSEPGVAVGSTVFVWMLRLGGLGMVAVAVFCFLGKSMGLLLDAVVSGVCGIVMLACGLLWMKNDGFVLYDIVIAVFGLMFIRAAWQSWTLAQSAVPQQESPAPAKPPEPPHPASVHPASLPLEGEPPPPDGFLAALAEEKQEPPTASYE